MPEFIKPATDLKDHGIAVYSGACRAMTTWRDAETGRDYVYGAILSTTSLVVQIDVASGKSKSFYMAPAGGPFGMTMTLEGHVLVTGASGELCRIDPKTGKSWITGNTGKWLWTVARGPDGKYYLGTSPECELFRYDAATEQMENLGPIGFGQTYLRKIVGGNDGYIYCSIGTTASQIVAYHIASGRKTALLPKADVGPYFLDSFGRGCDGKIYVLTNRGTGYRIEHGEAFPVKNAQKVINDLFMMRPYWLGYQELPDGRPVVHLDPDAIQVGIGARAKIIPYKVKTGGANIFHLAEGPGKAAYASTIMPLFLVRYAPAKGKVENLGRGGPDNGEAYSFGHCDGKLYYANYPSANLMVYDPAKPLHKDPPGAQKWQDNPRWLGYLGTGNCRPRAMTIDIKKRVWVGGQPEYGYRHGGLACYDIVRKKLVIHDKVIPDQSISALAADAAGDIVYGASNVGRGGGLAVVEKEAYLFAWDTRKNKLLWKMKPISEAKEYGNLLYRDGKLYGTSGFHFFRFDVTSRKMDYVIKSEISAAREISTCFGPDGNIYGITWMVLYRWRPETGQIEELYRCLGDDAKDLSSGSLFHRGAVIIDGRYYFSCGPKVMSLRLPL